MQSTASESIVLNLKHFNITLLLKSSNQKPRGRMWHQIHPLANRALWQFPITSHEEIRKQDPYHVTAVQPVSVVKNEVLGLQRQEKREETKVECLPGQACLPWPNPRCSGLVVTRWFVCSFSVPRSNTKRYASNKLYDLLTRRLEKLRVARDFYHSLG